MNENFYAALKSVSPYRTLLDEQAGTSLVGLFGALERGEGEQAMDQYTALFEQITAAGWDPGTDSVMRALFEAMAPVGVTFTNFGRGRSMGHSVAARAIAGVADATSITIPLGGGRHSRLVYVVLEEGATFEAVKAAIQADPYFSHDPLDVRQVTKDELPRVADASHGVLMERVGASGHGLTESSDF